MFGQEAATMKMSFNKLLTNPIKEKISETVHDVLINVSGLLYQMVIDHHDLNA